MDAGTGQTTHFYEPTKGHGLKRDPFKAIVAPRPIGWISTVDAEGRVNLAPYSFFNGVSSRPPMVYFSSEGRKDSLANIEATGEFVCNFVSMALAHAMNETAATLPHGTDEMALAGLAPAPSRLVRPPRVAAAPAALECRVAQVLNVHNAAGKALNTWMVIGEVVGVHIDPAFLKDGIFDTAAAHPVARCGYRGDYADVSAIFEMVRPG
jgi:flavin reductase (DIM6/NTAB) family NADH-FMN oxidoreductase RutF